METIAGSQVDEIVQAVNEPIIAVSHLYKSFGDNHVLKDFNVTVNPGENLVVLGKSGSGKSVLIKCIIGLLNQDKGSIKLLGQEVADLDPDALDQLRIKVGFLFQSNALYDSMTIRENLEFKLRRHWKTKTKKEVNDLVMEVLENVGLPHTVDMMPAELSGGMQKRVALARTLILKPKVILYDEPTTGLDPVTGKEISNLIVEMQEKYKASSIIISHDMHCVKITADRVVLLLDGKCYIEGTYDELEKSDDENVKQFFL